MTYKYYPPNEFSFCALMSEFFWCSKRKFLNDPFDTYGEIILNYPKLVDSLESKGLNIKRYDIELDSMGVCSFTTSFNQDYFWNEYSKNYSGWVLEFDDSKIDDDFILNNHGTLYHKVYYRNDWPDLDDFDTEIPIEDNLTVPIRGLMQFIKPAEKFFLFLLLLKNEQKWGMEDEIRILLGKNHKFVSNDKKNNGLDENGSKCFGYKLPWPKGILKRIIVGHNISTSHLDTIKQVAKCKQVPLFSTKTINSGLGFEIEIVEIKLD
jgi:hypothetical protein